MTTPSFDYLKSSTSQPPSTDNQQVEEGPDFSYLKKPELNLADKIMDTSVFQSAEAAKNRIGDVASGLFQFVKSVGGGLKYGDEADTSKIDNAGSSGLTALEHTGSDLYEQAKTIFAPPMAFGGGNEYTGKRMVQVVNMIEGSKEAAKGVMEHPVSSLVSALFGLTEAVVGMGGDAFSAVTGLSATKDLRLLNQDDRDKVVKTTVANVTLVGAGALFKGVEVLDESLLKRASKAVIAGGSEGLVYGQIDKANTPEAMQASISNAIVFGSFGGIVSIMGGKNAGRQIMYGEKKPISEILAANEALATSSSIDEAAARVAVTTEKPAIITTDNIGDVVKGAEGNVVVAEQGNNVLVNPTRLEPVPIESWMASPGALWNTPEDFFRKTGFLPDQTISYRGAFYTLRNVGDRIATISDGNKWFEVDKNEIKLAEDVQLNQHKEGPITGIILLKPTKPPVLSEGATKAETVRIAKAKALLESPTIPGTRTGVLNSLEEGGVPIFSRQFLQDISKSQFAKDFSSILTEYTPKIYERVKQFVSNAPQFEGTRFLGISTDPSVFGYNALWGLVDDEKSRILREHFNRPDLAGAALDDRGYAINPFAHDDLSDMIGTVVHEVVHNWFLHDELDPNSYDAQGGGADKMFEASLEQAMKSMPDLLGELHDKLNEAIINGSSTLDWYDSEYYQLKRRYYEELKNGVEQQRRTNEAKQILNARRNEGISKSGETDISKGKQLSELNRERESDIGNQSGSIKGEGEGIEGESNRNGNQRESTIRNVERPIQQLRDVVKEDALTNNMYVDEDNTVRDKDSGKVIGNASSSADAAQIIQKSGQVDGTDLTPPTAPPPPNSGDMVPPEPTGKPYLNPAVVKDVGAIEKLKDNLEIMTPWMTKKSVVFRAIDSIHGTRLFADVSDRLYKAQLDLANAVHPWIQNIRDLMQHAVDMSQKQMSDIFYHVQAMSADEMIMRGVSQRGAYKQAELELAAQWSGKLDGENVDVDKIYQYNRERRELVEQYQQALANMQNNPEANAGIQAIQKQAVKDLEQKQNDLIDKYLLTHKEIKVASGFEDVLKEGDLKNKSLYYITELMRKWQNPELNMTQDEYALKHNMSPTQLALSDAFTKMNQSLAQARGLENWRQINGYMYHFRRTGESPDVVKSIQGAPTLKGNYDKAFAGDLIRTGEISDYVDNPFVAQATYVLQAFRHDIIFPALKDAQKAAIIELNKLPQGVSGAAARIVGQANVEQLIDGIRGKPPIIDKAIEGALSNAFGVLGIDVPKNAARDLANTFLSWTSASMLAGKPELGLRDMSTFLTLYYSRFGAARTANAIKAMLPNPSKEGFSLQHPFASSEAGKVIADGNAPGLTSNDNKAMQDIWSTSDQLETGKIATARDFAQWVGDKAMLFNGQKSAFQLVHAAAYAESFAHITSNLKDFYSGKLDSKEFADAIHLNTYDAPIANEFIQLVNKGEELKAVEFMARQTGLEAGFLHGLNDHPYLWNSIPGRLFGQFGVYPVSAINYVGRLATRGSMAQRSVSMGRFIAVTSAIKTLGYAAGFNLANWSALHGLGKYGMFTGGPLISNQNNDGITDLVSAAASSMMGSEPTRQQAETIRNFQTTYGLKHEEDGSLSWDADRFKNGFKSMWVPGSYAFHNYMDAIDMAKGGYGIFPVVGRGLGFSLGSDGKDFLTSYRGGEPPDRDYDKVPYMDLVNPMASRVEQPKQ